MAKPSIFSRLLRQRPAKGTATGLSIARTNWALRVDDCPCDVHFIEWLASERLCNQTIYHFGTGGHHHVGQACARADAGNVVLGITASPKEYRAFVDLIVARPELSKSYSAYFGDIYTSNARLLPVFDVVTLFHSGEFRSARNDAYGALTDLEVMTVFAERTRAGGHILFYTGSFAYRRIEPTVAEWAASTDVEEVGTYKSLRIFRKRG